MDHDWWSDLEGQVLRCIGGERCVSVPEIAARVGLSEPAVNSLLALLAREGKVRIVSVERAA
jgi:hypothetical protein